MRRGKTRTLERMTISRTLPFAWEPWEKLQLKYTLALCGFPLVLMLATFIPLYFFAQWSSALFGIPPDAPVKDQPHGWSWFALFISVAVAAMVVGYLLGFVIEAVFCRLVLGWSAADVDRVFLRADLPPHWFRN